MYIILLFRYCYILAEALGSARGHFFLIDRYINKMMRKCGYCSTVPTLYVVWVYNGVLNLISMMT